MNFIDTLTQALRSIRSNRLRTGLTMAIIAFGIMALVGIITAIKAMNQKFTESFSTMGAYAFTVRFKERNIHFGNDDQDIKVSKKGKKREKKSNLGKMITKEEAELFAKRFDFPAMKSIYIFGGRNNIASYKNRKTSPNVMVYGGDEHFLQLNGYDVQAGRNIDRLEVQSGQNVALVGYDVAK